MDLVDIIVEKRFLGQEFLTWLLWASEANDSVKVNDPDEIVVTFGNQIKLEGGVGGEDVVACSGKAELPEVMDALFHGKKIQQAKLLLAKDGIEYQLTLTADLFEFKAVKLPMTEEFSQAESAGEYAGMILERVYLFEEIRNIVHSLFETFLQQRLSGGWGSVWRVQVSNWITQYRD